MDTSGSEGREHAPDMADEPGWDVGIEDDSGPMLVAIGRQLKLAREAAGLKQAEFGARIGYGENQVYKVEAGKRIPKPEYLDKADEVLRAGGRIAAMKEDVAQARYPKKVRDLARLEAEAVELGAYGNHNLHGLLQTEEYMRALFDMRRPALNPDDLERLLAARVARQRIFERTQPITLTFVQEEVTLRRPIGGKMVLRRQLEHLLEIGQRKNVEIQVMPTDQEDHAGMGGQLQVVRLRDGSTVGYSEAQLTTRLAYEPKEVHLLELRYGVIRSQALAPRASLAFIQSLLEQT